MLHIQTTSLRCVLAKIIAMLLLFPILYSDEVQAQDSPKKTLLVLSSAGGGGHIAASKTLQSIVGDEYDLKIVYPINQLRIWGVPSCEQVYNTMLRSGWVRSMNFIVRHVVPPIFRSRRGKVEKIISSYIDAHDPALVISLIPFINYPASEAARKKDIPFLLVTTDNDLKNWALDMEKVKHSNIKVTIGADLPSTREVLEKKKIPAEAIETIGLPLRLDFMNHKDKSYLLSDFHLPSNKGIILIMMGGSGGVAAYEYAKKIGNMNLSAHIIVIAGGNNKVRKELELVKLHPSNSMTVFGYTDRVSDLMAVSDVIVTKPGPGTINEAIAMKLPMLIDNTDSSLFWERANVDIVMKYGIGQKVKKFDQLKEQLSTYLKDAKVKLTAEESFVNVPTNQFHARIRGIIHELIAVNEQRAELESSEPTIIQTSLEQL